MSFKITGKVKLKENLYKMKINCEEKKRFLYISTNNKKTETVIVANYPTSERECFFYFIFYLKNHKKKT